MTRPVVNPLASVDELFARLGTRVVTHGCVADRSFVEDLSSEERGTIEHAVDVRRNEFAGGRACVRASFSALGVSQVPVVPRPDRSPIWPPQTVGSITHSEGYCMASVSVDASVSIGLDVEVVGRVTGDVAETAMSADERSWIGSSERPDVLATAVFAVKEALYKAQHPLTGGWLDFDDVRVSQTVDSALFRLDLVSGVAAVQHFSWPLSARWMTIEPIAGCEMVVAAVVV